jgi:hypothetical protein
LLAALAGGLTGRRLWCMPPILRGFRGRRPQVDATPAPPGQYMTMMLAAARGYVRTGASAEEVCGTLDVSEGNQRVLLQRARSRVQTALERHLDG